MSGRIFAPVASLLTGVAFLMVGHGLQLTVLPLRAAAEGFPALEIGILGSAYYVGFVGGCLCAPLLILRAGHIRVFGALVSLASACLLAHALFVGFIPWVAFRILIGGCLAGLYLIIESWLNDRATNSTRGVILSAYIVVNYMALTVGQLLVTLYAPDRFELFAIAALTISLAAIPVALTRSAQPALVTLVRFHPRALYASSPVGIVGVTIVGVANGAFWSLGTVFAVGKGLSTGEAAVFMATAVIAGAVAQWPVGRLSDRFDRRRVLLVMLGLSIMAGIALALSPSGSPAVFALAFLLGAAMLPTYAVAAAHAYDHADPANYVETSAGVLLANGLGAIVGPIIASVVMASWGSWTLFLSIAGAHAVLATFVAARLRTRAALSQEEKTDFDLAATAELGGIISPEPLDPDDPNVGVPPVRPPAPPETEEELAA